ncbi:MAG: tetraacyldisaccharide 4'-kinase [Rhizobiales bacterium 32-66-8]|nr:MAG: tetraacyldisaccharide 4'-kinase [Rhizobiales bacterium 32-66-8]
MFARAPSFWSAPGHFAATLLSPLGALVGAVTLHRMTKAGGAVPAVVICIGNPTVGGAGKTPTARALLKVLIARGARPFALLRGHGGREAGPLRVDPARHDAAAVGDEALLLAEVAPTIVARDRRAGAQLAVSSGASHIVMDDGFQNPSLLKDASLLVVDGSAGIGNGRVLPAGPLRAPLLPQVARADAVLVIGTGAAGAAVARAVAGTCPVLHGRIAPEDTRLAGARVLAFAGIGRPEKFFTSLREIGARVEIARAFPDHHPYAASEIAALLAQADASGVQAVTTTKDFARLTGPAFQALRPRIATLPVSLALDAPETFAALIETAEARAQARRA